MRMPRHEILATVGFSFQLSSLNFRRHDGECHAPDEARKQPRGETFHVDGHHFRAADVNLFPSPENSAHDGARTSFRWDAARGARIGAAMFLAAWSERVI